MAHNDLDEVAHSLDLTYFENSRRKLCRLLSGSERVNRQNHQNSVTAKYKRFTVPRKMTADMYLALSICAVCMVFVILIGFETWQLKPE